MQRYGRASLGRWRDSSAFRCFRSGSCCCPHEVVPLHIFEERYKHDDRRVPRARRREFGIVWLADDGPARRWAARPRITQRARALRGRADEHPGPGHRRRSGCVRRIEDLPYPAGDVELLDDDGDGGRARRREARARYAELVSA